MKKVCVLLPLVLLLLLPAFSSQAADLQEGWYAHIIYVDVWTYDDFGQPVLRGGGGFYDTPPGTYWPFLVTDGQYHSWYERNILVPTSVSGVATDHSLMIPMFLPLSVGEKIAYLAMPWETDYDADEMYLQLWRKRLDGSNELVWEQTQSGQQSGGSMLSYDSVFEGPYYFKVNVVPEPSSIECLLMALLPLAHIARRRR